MLTKRLSVALPAACLAVFAFLTWGPAAVAQQQSPAPAQSATQPAPAAAAPARTPSEAQVAPHHWDVDRVRCSDLLRASDDDRASAAMFYYGYLAAKAGIHVIDVSHISDNIAKVMRQCEATPNLTVPQAFRQALRPSGRG
ncbi:MAG TPA: HdeA/HdeB family chaperone [Stellaceae bacterium]|jgi:pyruvate/2-oxoglutarate dehydrogenase complex dihydrolipoamide acyltransferase (E2) component|nr:HdeA/HdeB family chaperone [Stellaceae bacterium]